MKQTGSVHFCAGAGLDARAEEEALLRYGDLAICRVSEGDDRNTRLSDQAFHDLVDRLVAGGGLRVPEVLGGGIGIQVGGEIVVHALTESFFAHVILHGEQHVAGLAVGDTVEHLVDFVRSFGPGADGARGWLRIEVQSACRDQPQQSDRCSTRDAWRRRACFPSRWQSPR